MTDFKLSDFLPYRIAILSSSMSGLIAQAYESRFGLTLNQWRVLFILGEHETLSANEISSLSLMDKMTVSRVLKKLAARKLIDRTLSASDNRKTIITLSLTGRSIHAEILPIARQYEEQLQVCLTDEENQMLSDIIKRLQTQIRAISG